MRTSPTGRSGWFISVLFLPFLGVALAVLLLLTARMNGVARGWFDARAQSIATVMSNLVAANLDFDDGDGAHDALATLSGEQDAVAAAVFADGAEVLASWPDRGQVAPELVGVGAGLHVVGDRLIVVRTMETRGGRRGAVAIALSTRSLAAQNGDSDRRAALAALAVAAVGLLLSIASGWFVTRRRAAEAELRQAELGFRALIDGMPDAILVHRDRRVIYANLGARRLLDVEANEALVGRELDGLVTSPPAWSERAVVEDRVEVELGTRRSRTVIAELSRVGLRFGGSDAEVLVVRDVTERKRLYERLVRTDRLASIGTLAAGVAHEINNPLMVVAGNLEFIGEAERANPTTGEALRDAADAVERIRLIVRDLKALSRNDTDEPTALDVHAALERALQMTSGQIKLGADVVRDFGTVPLVAANEPRLVQVFINLLVNAAQALPDDARRQTIRVTTRCLPDGRVEVAIADAGAGIPTELRDRIFDPFFTTKAVGVGTGLGLSICHSLVTSLGGTLHFDSEVGRGTTMFVTLPAAGPETLARPGATRGPAASSRARVLVVDDEAAVGRAVERALTPAHDVVTVTGAVDGLDRIAGGERFDLILCDLVMPTMNGLDFRARLAAACPEQIRQLVLMTGGANDALAAAAAGTSCLVLEKPFLPGQLDRLVREHAERRLRFG